MSIGQGSLLRVVEPRLKSDDMRSSTRVHARIRLLAVCGIGAVAILAAGICIGIVWSREAGREKQAEAACMALDMVAAQGLLDDVARRRAMRALTSALNPHVDRLAVSYRDVRRACDILRHAQ
jgi:hypothetical protein